MASGGRELRCSFCMKSERDVTYLLGGVGQAYICGECVESCNRILASRQTG